MSEPRSESISRSEHRWQALQALCDPQEFSGDFLGHPVLAAFAPNSVDLVTTNELLGRLERLDGGDLEQVTDDMRRAVIELLKGYCAWELKAARDEADLTPRPDMEEIRLMKLHGMRPARFQQYFGGATYNLRDAIWDYCSKLGWEPPSLPDVEKLRTHQEVFDYVAAAKSWIYGQEARLNNQLPEITSPLNKAEAHAALPPLSDLARGRSEPSDTKDGPIPPDGFRLNGIDFWGLVEDWQKVLTFVWKHAADPPKWQDVATHLGVLSTTTATSFANLILRINKKIKKQWPETLQVTNGMVVLRKPVRGTTAGRQSKTKKTEARVGGKPAAKRKPSPSSPAGSEIPSFRMAQD